MKFSRLFTALSLSLGLLTGAQAGLVGVKSIEVKNAIGEWLQVAEVIALDMSGADMALLSAGAVASAPDTWNAASTPSKAIDGITGGSFSAGEIFHEGSPRTGDTLSISLAAAFELSSIEIWGRSDCCRTRDTYTVNFLDASGGLLFTTGVDARGASRHGTVALPDTRAVPEPGSLALAGLGLLAFAARRRATRAD